MEMQLLYKKQVYASNNTNNKYIIPLYLKPSTSFLRRLPTVHMAHTDFTDEDDTKLVQAAKVYGDQSQPVNWDVVYKHFRHASYTKDQLRGRLKTLKQRWDVT